MVTGGGLPRSAAVPAVAATAASPARRDECRVEGATTGGALEELEISASAIEIRILWGRDVIFLQHLSPPRSFYVGEEEGIAPRRGYAAPEEKIGTKRAPLVLVRSGEAACVGLLVGSTGTIETDRQPKVPIAEAIASGVAQPCAEHVGGHEVPITCGICVRQELEDLVFEVREVRAGRKPAAPCQLTALAKRTVLGTVTSAAAHFGLLGALAFLSPPVVGDSDYIPEEQRYLMMTYLLRSAERAIEDQPNEPWDAYDTSSGAADEATGAGDLTPRRPPHATDDPRALLPAQDWLDLSLPPGALLRDAKRFGVAVFTGVGGDGEYSTCWGCDAWIPGQDAVVRRGFGIEWANAIGEPFGPKGLDLLGISEGEGPRGEGVGLQSVDTIGYGADIGVAQVFGDRSATAPGTLRPSPPMVRATAIAVSGPLASEVIGRIVHRRFGWFERCYARALDRNPLLEGRASVRFIIGRDGQVSNVGVGGDLEDGEMCGCVARGFTALSFPRPERSIVTVSFRLRFTPASAQEPDS